MKHICNLAFFALVTLSMGCGSEMDLDEANLEAAPETLRKNKWRSGTPSYHCQGEVYDDYSCSDADCTNAYGYGYYCSYHFGTSGPEYVDKARCCIRNFIGPVE